MRNGGSTNTKGKKKDKHISCKRKGEKTASKKKGSLSFFREGRMPNLEKQTLHQCQKFLHKKRERKGNRSREATEKSASINKTREIGSSLECH